jgi:hypothetical protein
MSAPRDEDDGVWRDEERLPLSELDEALATYSTDGQLDDPTGGDASAEEEFGDEERLRPEQMGRPSFEGHSGPS